MTNDHVGAKWRNHRTVSSRAEVDDKKNETRISSTFRIEFGAWPTDTVESRWCRQHLAVEKDLAGSRKRILFSPSSRDDDSKIPRRLIIFFFLLLLLLLLSDNLPDEVTTFTPNKARCEKNAEFFIAQRHGPPGFLLPDCCNHSLKTIQYNITWIENKADKTFIEDAVCTPSHESKVLTEKNWLYYRLYYAPKQTP